MDDKLCIGIIGVSQIEQVHLENYQAIPEVAVVAIAGRDREHTNLVAGRYGIPDVYTDFRELLSREDIQAVDVCLHNNLHMPVSVAALEAGNHVYCEKPIAGSYRDAEKMIQTAVALGLKLSIQLATLFSWETRAAKILIEQGWLGKPYHARSADFRHGPIVMVREGFPVMAIALGAAVLDDLRALLNDLRRKGTELLVISDQPDLLQSASLVLPLPPGMDEWLSPLAAVIPGQLFAMALAQSRGLDPDHPVGLTKVTETI